MWVGEPTEVTETSGETGPIPTPTFWASTLQCEPYNGDWAQHSAIHVYHELIVPDSEYDLQAFNGVCGGWSAPLSIVTSAYGDVVGTPYPPPLPDNCPTTGKGYVDCWTPPEGFVGFDDISSVVDKFLNKPGAPQKSRADLYPAEVDFKVDFGDIPMVVNGFLGLSCPYQPPPDPPCP
jgi:hypothetical protein